MTAAGARTLALPADVADRGALEAAAGRIAAELPPVTLLMNNARQGAELCVSGQSGGEHASGSVLCQAGLSGVVRGGDG